MQTTTGHFSDVGDGTTAAFVAAHGLTSGTAFTCSVTPTAPVKSTGNKRLAFTAIADNTNVTVTFEVAPGSTNAVEFDWIAIGQ